MTGGITTLETANAVVSTSETALGMISDLPIRWAACQSLGCYRVCYNSQPVLQPCSEICTVSGVERRPGHESDLLWHLYGSSRSTTSRWVSKRSGLRRCKKSLESKLDVCLEYGSILKTQRTGMMASSSDRCLARRLKLPSFAYTSKAGHIAQSRLMSFSLVLQPVCFVPGTESPATEVPKTFASRHGVEISHRWTDQFKNMPGVDIEVLISPIHHRQDYHSSRSSNSYAIMLSLLTIASIAAYLQSAHAITCLTIGSSATARWTNAAGQTCTWSGAVGSNFGTNSVNGGE